MQKKNIVLCFFQITMLVNKMQPMSQRFGEDESIVMG